MDEKLHLFQYIDDAAAEYVDEFERRADSSVPPDDPFFASDRFLNLFPNRGKAETGRLIRKEGLYVQTWELRNEPAHQQRMSIADLWGHAQEAVFLNSEDERLQWEKLCESLQTIREVLSEGRLPFRFPCQCHVILRSNDWLFTACICQHVRGTGKEVCSVTTAQIILKHLVPALMEIQREIDEEAIAAETATRSAGGVHLDDQSEHAQRRTGGNRCLPVEEVSALIGLKRSTVYTLVAS